MFLGDNQDYFMMESAIAGILKIIYILATFILTIIILNLLISILSNSFQEIKSKETIANYYEKAVMLQEIDERIPRFVIHHYEKKGQLNKYLFFAKCKSEMKKNAAISSEDILQSMNGKLNEILTVTETQNERKAIDNFKYVFFFFF